VSPYKDRGIQCILIQVYANGKELLKNLPVVLKSCSSSLEQLTEKIQVNMDDSTSYENVTEVEQAENNILFNNKKILEQKQTALSQWLSKVQGTNEKIIVSMLWEDTDET